MKLSRSLFRAALVLALPLASAPRAQAQDAAPVAAQTTDAAKAIAALREEYNAALSRQREAIEAAKTDEERGDAARKLAPDDKSYFDRAMAIAEKCSKSPDAYDALFFAISVARGESDLSAVVDRLIRDHLDDERIGGLAARYSYGAQGPTERLLVAMIEKSSVRSVRGKALLAMASSHKWTAVDDAAKLAAAHAEYEKVVKEYADVKTSRGTLGEAAEQALFALDHLVAGKPCPPIEGKDVDGVGFQLADYKGKVVMLDFWGFW